MSGKSFTDQIRRRKRRKKRQRQSHHDGEEEDLQSQDLLAGDEQEPVQHQDQTQNQAQETENTYEELEPKNGHQNENDPAASEPKVQEPSERIDESLSLHQAADNNENTHVPAVPRIPVEVQAQQDYGNNAAIIHNRLGPPPVHVPTEEEERLKGLLSHYINTVRNLERSNQRYRQELYDSRQECQKLKQALEKCRQKCKDYHKKYSAIKLKFYHWYNFFLQQWAAKFNQGQTRDLPPGPDTVGGLSPPALPPQQARDEDASVLSDLQPRRIFQDSSSSSGSSISPSPMAELNDISVLRVQDQRSTESNEGNENLHPNNAHVAPVAQGRNETMSIAAGDNTSIEMKKEVNDETQLDAPSKKAHQKKAACAGVNEDETQFSDFPQQEELNVRLKAKEDTTKADDVSVQSVCSDTQMILPPEDEASVQSSDDEDDDAHLKFRDSQNQPKSEQGQGHEQAQRSESNAHARSEKLYIDQDDNVSSSGAARRPSEAPPARKVSLSPNQRVPTAAAVRPHPDESLSVANAESNRCDKKRNAPELDASRRATKPLSENKKSIQSGHEYKETSQALFSQLPPTPPQNSTTKSTPTASKGRASSKNASALRAMEGWTSNVAARAFVQSTSMNLPAKKKQRVMDETVKPDTVHSNPAATTLNGKSSPNQSLPKTPARNPYSRSNATNATPKTAARMDWSDDEEEKDDSPARPYKYQEVVRCRQDREQLPGYCCAECDKFVESLCQDVFDKKEFLGMSRHRARHAPENTPPGFWDLSFADEIDARKTNKDDESP